MRHSNSFALTAITTPYLLAGIALTSPLCSAAQSTAKPDVEPVQVTASRLPEPPPVSMTVVDALQIEAQHGSDILDLLRVTPGISTTQPGGPGGISEVFLRSAESNFTVVLIDGVRVNDPSNPRGGGYDFSSLSADEIERVEIARGALSAVHGSDAMAGVINIVTRRPASEPSVSARMEGGTDSFQRVSAIASGPIGEDMAGSLKASYTDFGDAVEGSGQRLATAQGDLEFGDSTSGIGAFRGGLRYAERDRKSFADASGGPLFAVLRESEYSEAEETSAWAQTTRAFNPAWSMDTTASFFRRREETVTPPIVPGVFEGVPSSVSTSRFHRGQVTVAQRYAFSSALELGAGIDLQMEEGERDGELDLGFATVPSDFDLDRLIRAAYAEVRFQAESGFELYGAGRVDDSDDDKARGSGRVAARYSYEPSGTAIHASWSNGHKQPSFYSLGDTLVGNPNLHVETSETLELGVQQSFARDAVTASLTAFQTDYEDLIDFDFTTFRLVNRSQAEIDGIEGELAWSVTPTLTARVHATLTDIDLGDDGGDLLYRPEDYGGLQVMWRAQDRWTLHAQAQYVGKREGSSVPTGQQTLASYERVDLALSHSFTPHTTLFAAIDNVFDEDFQEALGFPNAGIQLRVGGSVTF